MKQHPQDYIYIRDSFHSLQSYIESEVLKKDRKEWTLKSIEYHELPRSNEDYTYFIILSCEFRILQGDRMAEIRDELNRMLISDDYYIIFEYDIDTHKFVFRCLHS